MTDSFNNKYDWLLSELYKKSIDLESIQSALGSNFTSATTTKNKLKFKQHRCRFQPASTKHNNVKSELLAAKNLIQSLTQINNNLSHALLCKNEQIMQTHQNKINLETDLVRTRNLIHLLTQKNDNLSKTTTQNASELLKVQLMEQTNISGITTNMNQSFSEINLNSQQFPFPKWSFYLMGTCTVLLLLIVIILIIKIYWKKCNKSNNNSQLTNIIKNNSLDSKNELILQKTTRFQSSKECENNKMTRNISLESLENGLFDEFEGNITDKETGNVSLTHKFNHIHTKNTKHFKELNEKIKSFQCKNTVK